MWMDALTQKVREGAQTVNVHALIATGVNADGPGRSGRLTLVYHLVTGRSGGRFAHR
jgi:hypothetical protein